MKVIVSPIYSLIKVLRELRYSHIKVFGCVAIMR